MNVSSPNLTEIRPKVTTLLSLSPPDGTTRYVNQLTDEAPPELHYRFFSWPAALFGRYDVFHVHWPEFLIRSNNLAVRWIRLLLFHLLLFRLQLTRTPLVRTLHNLKPHEPGDEVEAFSLARCDRLTNLYIRLNEATPAIEPYCVTILHGHYRGRYQNLENIESEKGRILYFGLIRPYKGVERLLEVFHALDLPELRLRVVGKPEKPLDTIVTQYCEIDPRISCKLEFVADEVLAAEVLQAELIVLPYKEMHNSGAVLVALSLDRPVLVPRSTSNELLSAEVGDGWVYMFEGELTDAILRECLDANRSTARPERPKLDGRDWSVVGELHYDAYRTAAALRRA